MLATLLIVNDLMFMESQRTANKLFSKIFIFISSDLFLTYYNGKDLKILN